MAVSQEEYEAIRDRVIAKYKVLYKDALAMDACEVPKEIRIRLFDDIVYLTKTKAIKANLFADQLKILNTVLAGSYAEEGKDNSPTILKALELKNKLLLEDLAVIKDDSNALNVTFLALTPEEFKGVETVTVNEGANSGDELGVDFGADEGTNSFEDRLKADVKKRTEELEKKDNGN